MTSVHFQHVDKFFAGGTKVLDDVCLQIEAGEFVVFVGPSGSGKSTLLRLLAGLDDPSGGEIHVGGRAAHLLPPSQRGIAMVFQSYALYPHMSVRDNLGFALRMAGQGRAAVAERVERTARSLQIEHLLDRKPQALSGGQRQRVAIGRAIVREPQVFLFDEPLSNLDAALRQSMRVELARLHQSLGTTMIYVTHDQVEAMTLADRIVVFDGGRVQQVGTPAQLYRAPANLFVAGFLGAPAINRLPARLLAQRPGLVEVFVEGLGTLPAVTDAGGMADDAALTLAIRPEHLGLERLADAASDAVRVRLVEYLGDHLLIYLDLPGRPEPLCAKVSGHQSSVVAGDAVRLHLPAEECLLFDAAGQALPRTSARHGGQA